MLQDTFRLHSNRASFSGLFTCPAHLKPCQHGHVSLRQYTGSVSRPVRQDRRRTIQAGLNYPHMPNRYRRKLKDLQGAGAEAAGDLKSRISEWPLSRKVAEAYGLLLEKLQPLFAALAKARAALEAWWEMQVDRYYEFCGEETKRKWRWKAYAQKEWDWWATFLQAALTRASAMIFITVWMLTAPTTIFMTIVLPILGAVGSVKFKSPLWPYMIVTYLVMVSIKLPWGLPIRFI